MRFTTKLEFWVISFFDLGGIWRTLFSNETMLPGAHNCISRSLHCAYIRGLSSILNFRSVYLLGWINECKVSRASFYMSTSCVLITVTSENGKHNSVIQTYLYYTRKWTVIVWHSSRLSKLLLKVYLVKKNMFCLLSWC